MRAGCAGFATQSIIIKSAYQYVVPPRLYRHESRSIFRPVSRIHYCPALYASINLTGIHWGRSWDLSGSLSCTIPKAATSYLLDLGTVSMPYLSKIRDHVWSSHL